jgi:hypothetical protein
MEKGIFKIALSPEVGNITQKVKPLFSSSDQVAQLVKRSAVVPAFHGSSLALSIYFFFIFFYLKHWKCHKELTRNIFEAPDIPGQFFGKQMMATLS